MTLCSRRALFCTASLALTLLSCSSEDRVVEVGSGGAGGGGGSAGSSACATTPDGDYFLALSGPLAAKTPVVFLLTLDNLNLSVKPLAHCDRTSPVGPTIDWGKIALGQSGLFDVNPSAFLLPKQANPVFSATGDPISLDISSFRGTLCGSFLCGKADGEITGSVKLSLNGSTWTATKVSSPADYPEPPPTNCSKTPADAKPGVCPAQ